MKITCESCQSRFKIADEKIPDSGVAAFRCPKCKARIEVPAKTAARPEPTDTPPTFASAMESFDADADAGGFAEETSAGFQEELPGGEKYGGSFDFVEEEGKTALICMKDPARREQLRRVTELMEYHPTVAKGATDALKKMQYHPYDMVIIEDLFDTDNAASNAVLAHLSRLEMGVRRNSFVALITANGKTMDPMTAFHRSVNIVVNEAHLKDVGRILERGVAESQIFYQPLREAIKAAGL